MRVSGIYLKDILAAMQAIEQFVEGMEFADFAGDDKTSSAVIRKFEIIGEAAKKISEDVKQKYPEVPWKEMSGMRDRLIHFYFGVKYDLLWETIKTVIPGVKPLISGVLSSLEKGNEGN